MSRTIWILFALFGFIHTEEQSTPKTVGIIGGTNAARGQFPHQVAFLLRGDMHCGGSIIAAIWVLTAAHCKVYNIRNLEVVAGTNLYKNPDKVGQTRTVSKFIVHPQYKNVENGFDIALAKVNIAFVFGPLVQPIPLYNSGISPTGFCQASGWGKTIATNDDSIPDRLQFASMNLVSYPDCLDAYGNLPVGTICANAPGKDACQGDSGGPLIIFITAKQTLLGVTSYGGDCGDPNYPGVYTYVPQYFSYIQNVMKTN